MFIPMPCSPEVAWATSLREAARSLNSADDERTGTRMTMLLETVMKMTVTVLMMDTAARKCIKL